MNAFEYQQIVELLAEGGINDQIHGIPVRVRFDGERYFISDEVVDLCGVGNTIEDARGDYWLAAQEAFFDLTAHADNLAPHLQHQLDLSFAVPKTCLAQYDIDHVATRYCVVFYFVNLRTSFDL